MRSETLKLFLDFVEESRTLYSKSLEEMKKEERRQQDYLHQIEFESNSKVRNKICTKLHRSRLERRRYKDMVEVCEPVVQFFQQAQNKRTLDKMTQLLGELRRVEKYHQNRSYRPRVPEG